MNILAISNYYPPHHFGGYELGCRDVVERLRARGHELRVLTSAQGAGASREAYVDRTLCAETDWTPAGYCRTIARLLRKEWINQRAFTSLADSFRPDVVYCWNLTGVSISAAAQAMARGIPVAYFVSDHWLTFPQPAADRWFAGWSKTHPPGAARWTRSLVGAVLRRLGVMTAPEGWHYGSVHFASHFLAKEAARVGGPLGRSQVIHWGIDLAHFPYRREPSDRPRRLLHVGQVVRHKGVLTSILATDILRRETPYGDVTLDVIGGSRQPEFVNELRHRVATLGLDEVVRFRGPAARDDLAAIYRAADVLIFPSEWAEPFALTPLEAMASGLPVAATLTGGTAEALEPEVNALTFEPGDARGCARQVERLLGGPALYDRLRRAARKAIEDRFRIEQMVDRIEAALAQQVRAATGPS